MNLNRVAANWMAIVLMLAASGMTTANAQKSVHETPGESNEEPHNVADHSKSFIEQPVEKLLIIKVQFKCRILKQIGWQQPSQYQPKTLHDLPRKWRLNNPLKIL